VKISHCNLLRLGAALALSLASITLPAAFAQSAAASPAQMPVPYDMSKEVQVRGTIQQIDTSSGRVPVGIHILVQTTSGVVDAHLGPLNKASLDALNLSVGESVALTGMNESSASGSLFLVRLLTTSTRIVILRNERGYPVRSLIPRGSMSPTAAMKGGL